MEKNNRNSGGSAGIGFVGFLTLLFIALKLLNKIEWSWVWVLSPLWITTLLVVIVIIVVVWMVR